MIEKLTHRYAVEDDIDFVLKCVEKSEKCRTDVFTYSRIFDIPEKEMLNILKEILLENIEGQELCLSQFIISEIDGEYVGGSSAWIEGETSSSFLKANIFSHYIPPEKLRKALPIFEMLKEFQFEREIGAIQHECVYVESKFRLPVVANYSIMEHIINLCKKNPDVKKSQGQITGINAAFVKLLRRIGFVEANYIEIDNKKILDYIPSNSRYLVERINK